MKRYMGVLVALAAIAAMPFAGCKSAVEPSDSNQQYFMDVVTGGDASTRDLITSDQEALSDGAMFSVAQTPLPPSIQSVTAGDKIIPQKWGRFVESVTRTITRTENQGDTVVIAEAIVTFSGHFRIIGTVDGVLDTVSKPFTESVHRYFRFLRVANTNHPRMNWRLDAVSIVNGGTTNAQIALQKVQVVPPSGDTLTATDPDNYFMQVSHRWMHRLPLWGFNTQVTVLATVHSADADTDIVTLHYAPKNNGAHRAPMTMISQTANTAGGFDRVYSYSLTIPGNDKKFAHVVVSAATYGSLNSTDTTNLSCVLWGMPYKTSE